MENLKSYREYFNSIESYNYFGRLGKVFKTNENYYFYDMGTGKVARCFHCGCGCGSNGEYRTGNRVAALRSFGQV